MLHKTLLKAGLVMVFWFVTGPMGFDNWGLIGLREWMLHTFFGRRRERRITTCPTCMGSGICTNCDGKGCAQCNGDGHCSKCHGEGNLVTGSGNEKLNT